MAKTLKKLAVLAGVAAIGAAPLALADSGASARMLAENCTGCHGTDGASSGPASPSIGGINGEYFVEMMKGYKEGTTPSTVMGRIAKGYSEEEIAKMSAFFAAKPFVPAKQKFDDKLAKKGQKLHDKYCEKCHAEGGKIVKDEEYYILAGQWSPYVKWQLADFRAGTREMPKKMRSKVENLAEKEGDAGFDALVDYYASQQ